MTEGKTQPHYALTLEEWADDTRKRRGHIEKDHYSKGACRFRQQRKNRWEVRIQIHGTKYRYRAKTRTGCEEWLQAVLDKRILPTCSEAEWLRAEQRKDMMARYQEMTASNAEECLLVYEYYNSGDIGPVSEYIVKRLLPHMVYYCCHTLHLGQSHSITYSKEAIALLLTKLSARRPVASMTALCKRIARMKRNGSTYYMDHLPKDMEHVVNGIDYAPLKEVWKVTKDRRL